MCPGMAALLVAGLSIAVFWPATGNEFIYFDDDAYVTENPEVNAGLSWAGVRWAFTAVRNANWHPLTWLSHMADVSLFGLEPWGHHLVNVLLHGANAGLVAVLLWRWSGALCPAALAAALWAVHPLRVESVAWVAERKDVLSLFFGLLCLFAYDLWVRRGGLCWGVAAWGALALGLMAKPMLVTLPCAMLLLDATLYGRLGRGGRAALRVLLEKAPFFALVLASVLVTLWAQRTAMQPPEHLPWSLRGFMAAQACAAYLSKTVWPWPLVPLYPIDTGVLTLRASLGGMAVVALGSIVALGAWRTRALPAGWFLFLGTLVPVLGIVAVGNQAYADRYTYLPSVGLALVLTWGLAAAWRWRAGLGKVLGVLGCLAGVGAVAMTQAQLARWKNTETLFRHTLEHTRNNSVAHNNLGRYLLEHGRTYEGLDHTRAAVQIAPANLEARFNFGSALLMTGDPARAAAVLIPLVEAMPNDAGVYTNLALALHASGDPRYTYAAQEALARLPEGHPSRAQMEALAQAVTTAP